ncbi:transglutaminase family protein [Bradyrhizobium sp. LA7.1]|uniref:transglutaminase family protein n=1 Tax=Bradyrhizobium sp. LA7.1 TaxID=3156324 RepID=UPI0033917914
MTDPKGQKLSNRLLASYLDTRRGNFITMPILFLILADRMHLPVALSRAPLHFFIKYTDDVTGQTLNLETTSGGYPARDSWIREQMPMTDQAIANGLYLRALTRRETLAAMAAVVVEADLERQRVQEGIEIANIVLEHDSTFAYMLAKRGSAFAAQIETEFAQKYPRPADIPSSLRPRYQVLQERNLSDFAKAEALGWREDQQAFRPASTVRSLRVSLGTIAGQKPLDLAQTFDNFKQNVHTLLGRYTFGSANFTNYLGEAVAHALATRRVSCCRFDGRLVKLIPPCVRTQQG